MKKRPRKRRRAAKTRKATRIKTRKKTNQKRKNRLTLRSISRESANAFWPCPFPRAIMMDFLSARHRQSRWDRLSPPRPGKKKPEIRQENPQNGKKHLLIPHR